MHKARATLTNDRQQDNKDNNTMTNHKTDFILY